MATRYETQKPVILQLQALALFHTHGLDAVKRTFPGLVDFVQVHKDRPFQEVKDELLHGREITA